MCETVQADPKEYARHLRTAIKAVGIEQLVKIFKECENKLDSVEKINNFLEEIND